MDTVKLQKLADKLAAYNGSTPYWDVVQNKWYSGRMLAIDALYSWKTRNDIPETDADYERFANVINSKLKPFIEHIGDMELVYDNFPKMDQYSSIDTDKTEFDFTEDAKLLEDVYNAYWKGGTNVEIDVQVMATLNEFLKELAAAPDLSHIKEEDKKAGNFFTIAELQFRAKNTTVIQDIDTLVATSGNSSPKPIAPEPFPVKELGALRMCKDLVVRKHWGAWNASFEEICDNLGNMARLLDYQTDHPSKTERNNQIDDFWLALGASLNNHLPYPISMTNFDEYTSITQFDLKLKDIAHYSAELINNYIQNSGNGQTELIASIQKNLAMHSLTQLQNISKLIGLDVYDNKATIGNFIPNGSFAKVEELNSMWEYIDETAGKADD